MLDLSFIKHLYKKSPMDFYTHLSDGSTIIKSPNGTSLGYIFNRTFTERELDTLWEKTRTNKRISTIIIVILFLLFLYEWLFPRFTLFAHNNWYVNAAIYLVVLYIVYKIITLITTHIFEKRLFKHFGQYKKTTFIPSKEIDEKYYNLFKTELIKAFSSIFIVIIVACTVSPFKLAYKMIKKEHYKQAIHITSIGAKLFPIAPEWYSLRAYAKFQTQDFQGAIKDYDTAYSLGADGFNIMNFDNKIFVKYYLKEYQSALNDFDREIQNADNDNERDQFLWDKAQFLYNIKQYDQALILYNELLVKSENDRIFLLKDRLYLERAQVYNKLGQKEFENQDLINSGILNSDENIPYLIPKPILILDEIISANPI